MATTTNHHTAFHGVISALVTPMTAQQEVDHRQLARIVDHQIRQGLHGLIPLGSTGEFYALSPDERGQVLKTVLRATAGRVPVIAGANAGSTREVIEHVRQAERLGCDGIMLAAPFYSLPRPDELLAHFRAVDAATGLPIMLYNYPGRTGVDMTPAFIERLAALKHIRYVKESTGEMPRITELMRRCGDRLGVFCGCDTIALESLLVGAVGWVGGIANVLPRSHVELVRLVEIGDLPAARALFFSLLPTLELMEGGGKYTQWVKAATGLMGFRCGPPRRPLGMATPAECTMLRTALRCCAEGRAGIRAA